MVNRLTLRQPIGYAALTGAQLTGAQLTGAHWHEE